MSGGGGGGQTQTIQKSDPWAGVQPFLVGNQTTEQRLKQGVTPIYQSNNPLTWEQWSAGNNGDEWDNPLWGEPQSSGKTRADYDKYVQDSRRIINPASDYETVTTGTPGIYGEAQRLYQQGGGYVGQTPEQLAINKNAMDFFSGSSLPQEMSRVSRNTLAGIYDPNISKIGDVSAGQVNLSAARAAQGALDPTSAMLGILSGQADTTGLDALQRAATNRAMVGYGDAVTDAGRMFSEQIAPSIRGGAQVAGQYGGSRQGIAEGIAARGISEQLARNARDLGISSMDVGTQLYGDAARRANEQRYGIAGLLNAQAADVATGNVNRDFEAQRANQQAQQVNNAQEMQRQEQRLANQQAGLGIGQQALGTQGGIYDSLYGIAERARADQLGAQQYPWEQLQRYASIVSPGAGIGGTTTSSSSGEDDSGFSLSGALGGGLAGGGLASTMGLLGGEAGMTNPLGWGLIGGSALLGGLR